MCIFSQGLRLDNPTHAAPATFSAKWPRAAQTREQKILVTSMEPGLVRRSHQLCGAAFLALWEEKA